MFMEGKLENQPQSGHEATLHSDVQEIKETLQGLMEEIEALKAQKLDACWIPVVYQDFPIPSPSKTLVNFWANLQHLQLRPGGRCCHCSEICATVNNHGIGAWWRVYCYPLRDDHGDIVYYIDIIVIVRS